MAEIVIAAQSREEFGKGAARRLRRENMIPAVLYGHGGEPIHVALPAHVTTLALRTANALLDIQLSGHKPQLALPRQIQRDPVTDKIEHVDLLAVKRGERVHVEVPLLITGEVKGNAIVIQDQATIMLEVEATAIPARIEISVEGYEVGETVYAKDLALPAGAVFQGNDDDLILSVQAPQAKDMGETPAEESAEQEADETTED